MNQKNKQLSTDEAWKKILETYNILDEIEKNGVYHIKAKEIRKYREPRLMCKWDSSEQLPPTLKNNKINVLPDSRSSYIIGDFILYEKIPELTEHPNKMTHVILPEYESVDIDNINSEAIAINVLILSKILDDFLDSEETVETFNGRMGTGEFEFDVDSIKKEKRHIVVKNAQCEIDGGFENDDEIVILEAKNVVHEDFHVRQLYYPYRLWRNKVAKPIRLVFSIYSNKIFRLFEYEFEDINDYSSIKLIQAKNYSLEDTTISLEDLKRVKEQTPIKYNDYFDSTAKNNVPFIQANSFDRVISLLEHLYETNMNDAQIAKLMHFGYTLTDTGKQTYRQSQYYYNAGKYLGLFDRKNDPENGIVVCLTDLGKTVYKMHYKERQLKLVSLILEHQIFNELFDLYIKRGTIPDNTIIAQKMRELHVCGESQINRRASSVKRWLIWIFNLIEI